MLRKLDFWASRHRAGLATAALALLALAVLASALELRVVGMAAIVLAFAAFIGLAVGIRYAGGGDHGGGTGSGIGDGGG